MGIHNLRSNLNNMQQVSLGKKPANQMEKTEEKQEALQAQKAETISVDADSSKILADINKVLVDGLRPQKSVGGKITPREPDKSTNEFKGRFGSKKELLDNFGRNSVDWNDKDIAYYYDEQGNKHTVEVQIIGDTKHLVEDGYILA